jgi:hypothetical protein
VSDFDGIDPRDIEDLKAKAEKIVKDATTYYEIGMYVPHEGATEFLATYEKASKGSVLALMDLLMFIHVIADSLKEAVENTSEQEQEGS